MATNRDDDTERPGQDVRRRDFLVLATAATGVVGIGSAAWPLIDSMNPDAQARAAAAPVGLDLGGIKPGQNVQVTWRGQPVFVLRRTDAMLRRLREHELTQRLADPKSESRQQPAYADNWHRSIKPEYLVVVGICTHLGCIPDYRPKVGAADLGPNWPGGYFCPCHGSKYDLAGRVYQGVPAPLNLPVPPYRYVGNSMLRIGENPQGASFSFSSIEEI